MDFLPNDAGATTTCEDLNMFDETTWGYLIMDPSGAHGRIHMKKWNYCNLDSW